MDRGFVEVHVIPQCCIAWGDDGVTPMLNKSAKEDIITQQYWEIMIYKLKSLVSQSKNSETILEEITYPIT